MQIINSIADIQQLKEAKIISKDLAEHLERKVRSLHTQIKQQIGRGDFSLAQYGILVLLEKGDRSLREAGLPEAMEEIMPEWVSRLEVAGEIYFILYLIGNTGSIYRVYVPNPILEEIVRYWLLEQPVEE